MATVLITGGAGFIGSHVGVALTKRGDQVVLLDDFNDRYDPRLKEARIEHMFAGLPAPVVARASILDRPAVERIFAQHPFDTVVHLAAWASVQPSITNPHIYTEVNIDGTVNILEASRRSQVKNIVFASSSSVYGGKTQLPFKETDDVSRPISPYAATKAAGEILCATWHHLYALPISCVRFFTVYGPWGRPEMAMFKFTEAILTGKIIEMRGEHTQRDFTYIDDAVQGVLGAIDHPQGFMIYNLGESDGVPLPRLLTALEAALHKKAKVRVVPLPAGDVPATLADISRARKYLQYAPTTSIEDGVKKFAAWYQDWYLKHFSG